MKFAQVISADTVLKMFDDFHYKITGEQGYGLDENRKGDDWYDFYIQLTLASKNGIIDEKEEE